MDPRTRTTRETWKPVTDPSLSALVGAGVTIVLVPVAVTLMAAHLAVGGGLLLGIALSRSLSRLTGREAGGHHRSNPARTAETPRWFDGLDGSQRSAAHPSPD